MATSLSRKVGLASLIMVVSIFSSRVIGLVREMAIAWVGGTSAAVDAYQVAFILPEILNHVVASGFLSVTFIPILTRHLTAGREAEGWQVLSRVHNVFGLLLMALTAVAMVQAPALVRLAAPGLAATSFSQAVRMTRIILPAQIFFFSGGLFMAAQFSRERFLIPALAPLLYNLGIIAGGLLLGPILGMEGFAWGVLAGAATGNLALQYRGARRAGMRLQPLFDPRHPDVALYLRLTLPLMVGLSMTFSTEIFLKFFGSYLPAGSIAALNYGLRVMLMLVALFGQAAGTASFPFLAKLAAQGRQEELQKLLNGTLRALSLVIPFAALLAVLRHEVVLLLFQRGRFDAAATDLTARLLALMLIGAFAFAVQTVVARGFYARQNTWLPALYGTVAALASIPFYGLGLKIAGADGVALAVSLGAIVQVILLFSVWNRESGNVEARAVYRCFGQMLLLGLGLGGTIEAFRRLALGGIDTRHPVGSLLAAGSCTVLFLVLLILAARVFQIKDLIDPAARLTGWLRRRRGPAAGSTPRRST